MNSVLGPKLGVVSGDELEVVFSGDFGNDALLSFEFSMEASHVLFREFKGCGDFDVVGRGELGFSYQAFCGDFSSFRRVGRVRAAVYPVRGEGHGPVPTNFGGLVLVRANSLFFPTFPFDSSFCPVRCFFFGPEFYAVPLGGFLAVFCVSEA